MLNPKFSIFDENMFLKVNELFDKIENNSGKSIINLTIGEPQMSPPKWINDIMSNHLNNWHSYPKASADKDFLNDLSFYFRNRFESIAEKFILDDHIVPVPGTREPLNLIGFCVKDVKPNQIACVTNPFYHAWRTGALSSDSKIVYLNANKENNFLPDLNEISEKILKNTVIMYLCSPSNPQGTIASIDYIKKAIDFARYYNFLLVFDECYIDIWRNIKPSSALQVCFDMEKINEDPFKNLIVVNSLSKRSNSAGLRAGFICGDKRFISAYKKLVSNGAALVQTPILRVAGSLYRDNEHNEEIRAHYDYSFKIIKDGLKTPTPNGGFFLWFPVPEKFKGNDKDFTSEIYANCGIKVMPGSLMGQNYNGYNPASGYVRLAIVHNHKYIKDAVKRLANFMKN